MRHRALTAGTGALVLAAAARLALGLGDIPPTAFVPPGPPPEKRPLLARTHDLLRMFAEGDGALEASRDGLLPSGPRVTALPWRVARGREGALQIHWNAEEKRRQGTAMIVLTAGQRWCTPRIAIAREARLRFEALALDARQGRVEVAITTRPAPWTLDALPAGPDGRAADLPLPEGATEICLAARGGNVGLAEPRLLAPVPPDDTRPRWVVVAISDSLRADAWKGPDAAVVAPRAAAFAATARRYEDARAPGSHTSAAMWPVFTGRDLMRIAPGMRLNPQWGSAVPLDAPRVFSLPNVFLSQYADSAGYRTAFFGNNTWLGATLAAFGRFALQGSGRTGTYDGARELPAFLARYADERLLLVSWTSAAHRGADLVQRLADELGCGAARSPLEQLRCEYRARVRHNDEGIGALLDGLAYYGVREESLVVLTADHGDALEDGWTLEAPDPEDGIWKRMDSGHGSTTGATELAVPLLVSGPGIAPGSWTGRVSTLDVAPTLVAAMGARLAGRVDGQVLPLFPGGATTDGRTRRLVAYGYCGHSDTVGARQLVWWDGSSCPIRRRPGDPTFLTDSFELRVDDALVPAPPASEMRTLRRAHGEWLAERFVGETIVFDPSALPPGSSVTVTAPEGRIVDHGPSGTRWGLEQIGPAAVSADGRAVSVRFDGYRGLYAVTTRPVRTKVSVQVTGGAVPTIFVGPYQLPIDPAVGPIDPASRPDYVVSAGEPARQPSAGPVLRLWWQPYEPVVAPAGSAAMEEFNRVLRDWGYIR